MHTVANFPTSIRGRDFSIACVVPVYNEGEHIAAFLRTLHECLTRISPHAEIIVVNDGSYDNSAEQVLSVAEECGVHYIELARNFGK